MVFASATSNDQLYAHDRHKQRLNMAVILIKIVSITGYINRHKTLTETSMKGTIGPGRLPLAYLLSYVFTVSHACA